MRTTVTLDADTEQLIRDEMGRSQRSFKETLNDAIRRGLVSGSESGVEFRVEVQPMGLRTGLDPTRLADLDQQLEEQRFVKVTRGLMDQT